MNYQVTAKKTKKNLAPNTTPVKATAPLQLSSSDLIGVWTLEQFIIVRENGEHFNWPGRQNGTLIYTGDGYVSVAQNREPLPNPTAEDKQRVSNFYTGTYRLDLENGRVFHTALQSSVPSLIGTTMERRVTQLKNGHLQISGTGLKEEVILVWRKLSKSQ